MELLLADMFKALAPAELLPLKLDLELPPRLAEIGAAGLSLRS